MKSRLSPASITFASVACCLLLGCGTVDPKDDPPAAGGDGGAGGATSEPLPTGPLLPWAVGNTWTYRVTKDGTTALKTTTVGELEPVGGEGPNAEVMAYHVTTAKGTDQKDRTESWQGPSSDEPLRIVRYREQSFDATSGKLELEEYWDPPRLHIDGSDEHTAPGANWLDSYSETKLPVGLTATTKESRDLWAVVDNDETVEVPAGTFEHVIHFRKVGGSTKEYWYVRGVGKIKETGSQTEELTEASLEDAP